MRTCVRCACVRAPRASCLRASCMRASCVHASGVRASCVRSCVLRVSAWELMGTYGNFVHGCKTFLLYIVTMQSGSTLRICSVLRFSVVYVHIL